MNRHYKIALSVMLALLVGGTIAFFALRNHTGQVSGGQYCYAIFPMSGVRISQTPSSGAVTLTWDASIAEYKGTAGAKSYYYYPGEFALYVDTRQDGGDYIVPFKVAGGACPH